LEDRSPSRLTREKIDPSKLLRSAGDPGAGGTVLFLGTVRNNSEAGSVEKIEYQAYEPMAEKSLGQAEEEVMRRWPDTRHVRILHRVGVLPVGEISVAVVVSSAHRAEAFEACRHAIERVKHDVPIWKREKLSGGKEVWVEGVPIGSRSGPERPPRRNQKTRKRAGRRKG
jgi:molybdopterin synthase catalytic subunit